MKNLLLLLVLAVAFPALGQTTYPFTSGQPNARNWMGYVDNNTKLHTMSIPGTHDSGCVRSWHYTGGSRPFADCQYYSIHSQLNLGVRFLDVRIGRFTWLKGFKTKRGYRIAHSNYRYKQTLQDVFDEIIRFLNDNPSEVIIMSLKVERGDDLLVRRYCRGIINNNRSYIYSHDSPINSLDVLPSVHSLRKKIVILDRSGFGPGHYPIKVGIETWNWGDNKINREVGRYVRIQDNYTGVSYADKRRRIRDMKTIARTNNDPSSTNVTPKLVVNYASSTSSSGSIKVTPATAASFINPYMITDYNSGRKERCILVVDFATSSVINPIWKCNFNGNTYDKMGGGANTQADKLDREVKAPAAAERWVAPMTVDAAPNPAAGPFRLIIKNIQQEERGVVTICDLQGKIVLQKETNLMVGTNRLPIEESVFSTGLFIVQITTESGERVVTKLVYQ